MTITTLFWLTLVFYTILISMVLAIDRKLHKHNKLLQEYFYQVDYHRLKTILKDSGKGDDDPPDPAE